MNDKAREEWLKMKFMEMGLNCMESSNGGAWMVFPASERGLETILKHPKGFPHLNDQYELEGAISAYGDVCWLQEIGIKG